MDTAGCFPTEQSEAGALRVRMLATDPGHLSTAVRTVGSLRRRSGDLGNESRSTLLLEYCIRVYPS